MLGLFNGQAAARDARLPRIMQSAGGLLDLLPVGVCICDADGTIVYHNDAAAELWGRSPGTGSGGEKYSGAAQLFAPDGAALPREFTPVATALRERRPLRGVEILATRPDGSRIPLLAYPTPVHDETGELLGVIDVLVDVAQRKAAEKAAQRLAAIVDSTDDAILALDRDGIVTSWNAGAARLYQYSGGELIGRPIGLLIPPDRAQAEARILERVLRGERVERYESVRLRRDGTPLEVSLTVSPILDAEGAVTGVSKIARDITERQRAQERRDLLLAEMNHRVKNLLVMAGGIVSLSARSATSARELAADVVSRLAALARAHELTLPSRRERMADAGDAVSLHALVETIVTPFDVEAADGSRRVTVSGPDIRIAMGSPLTGMALLLHEFATNAAKHGAFAHPEGTVEVRCGEAGDRFVVAWLERGGPPVRPPGADTGFGSKLVDLTVRRQLAGEITRDWRPEGLALRLEVERDRLLR